MTNEIEIDLNDYASLKEPKTTKPTLGEKLYAQSLAANQHPEVSLDDETVNKGVKGEMTQIVKAGFSEAEKPAITEGLLEFGIDVDASVEDLIALAVQDGSSAMYLAVRSGMAFMAAQERLNNGECAGRTPVFFKDFIQNLGYSKERAYENIRLAKGYLNIPAAQRKGFIALGKKKAMRLSALEPEQINELIEQSPDALDEFALISRQEMIKRIKNLEANFDKLRDEKEILERQQKRTTKPGELAYNPRTFEVRHEAAALEYASRIHVDALETMWDEVANEDATPQEKQLQEHAIGLAAAALLARAGALYERISMALGNEMPIKPSGKYLLSSDEKQALEASVAMVDANFSNKKKEREAARYADAPVRRGRPAGSKNRDKAAD